MKIQDFDIDKRPLLIAEVGNNHEGDFALAERMVELAAECGAHAVKFQTLRAERLIRRSDEARFQRLQQFELSYSQFEQLAERARKCGVIFMSTPFDIESARFLRDLCPAIKIASSDNNFIPLLQTVAEFDLPIILSTGAADLARVARAKATIEEVWTDRGADPGLVLLHCVSAYPTPTQEANLAAIDTLRRAFDCRVGYSDHTLGVEAAAVAAALGAEIIEKHFTIDKKHSDFRDHQLSADPEEFKQLVERVTDVLLMLGDGAKRVQTSEQPVADAVQRRIVAAADLAAGIQIEWEHLNWVRSAEGIVAGEEGQLLGRRTTQAITKGQVLGSHNCGWET